MDEEKFIQRVERMLFEICGCTAEEATIIPNKCLERIKKNEKRYPHFRKELNFIKSWAEYIRTHPDEEWSEQQNIIINSQLINSSKNKTS